MKASEPVSAFRTQKGDGEPRPCPACGGSSRVVSSQLARRSAGERLFRIIGLVECVNECWRADLTRYLTAVRAEKL